MTVNSYRLDPDIIPIKYNLRIIPVGPTYDKFIGRCIIGLRINKHGEKQIILNGANLTILTVKLIGSDPMINYKHMATTYDNSSEIQQIKLEFDSVPDNLGVLTIEYEGIVSTELTGFYKCTQDDKLVMLTQFEPVSARRCFPCFDEPHFKAVFELEIVAPADRLVLSNMNVDRIIPYDTMLMYVFKPTPLMSTYLVAFYIGHADYIEALTADSIRIRIYTPKNKSYSKLALDTAVKCMEFMTQYFDMAYPLEKLDLISAPQFASGAMENWGLVVFKEKALICDPTTCTNDQINIVYTICHELAHQWFGNLVTMNWWSELWLNESFATWMGWLAVDHLYPDWNVNNKFFYDNYIRALTEDSVHNSHPIKVDIANPSNIKEVFDTISYCKGSSIIKMLVEYVGENNFRQAIRLYIKKYAYGVTTTSNLWECLETITKKNISSMMHNWICKKNYPLVTVVPHGSDHLEIMQDVFTYTNIKTNNLWIIPLSNNVILHEKKIIISKLHFETNINNLASGFYKIFYHETILDHIIQHRSTTLSDLDRSAMLSDLYFLLKADKITYNHYLEYTDKILSICSDSELVWGIILDNYSDFRRIIKNNKILEPYNQILIKYVKQFNFEIVDNDSFDMILFKTTILSLGCALRIDSRINYCLQLFNRFVIAYENDKSYDDIINPNIIHIVFSIGLKESNRFDFLMNLLSNSRQFESVVLKCVGLSPNPIHYITVLDLFKTNKVSDQYKPKLFMIAGLNPKLNHMLWPYIRDNWNLIFDMFKNRQGGLAHIISSMDYLIGNADLVKEIELFFKSKDKHNMEFAYKKMIEVIQINYLFSQRMSE